MTADEGVPPRGTIGGKLEIAISENKTWASGNISSDWKKDVSEIISAVDAEFVILAVNAGEFRGDEGGSLKARAFMIFAVTACPPNNVVANVKVSLLDTGSQTAWSLNNAVLPRDISNANMVSVLVIPGRLITNLLPGTIFAIV
jgi:hypothetical protein